MYRYIIGWPLPGNSTEEVQWKDPETGWVWTISRGNAEKWRIYEEWVAAGGITLQPDEDWPS